MDIIISNSAGRPIYDQISSQIKEKIINGDLNEGDPLPSMRLLAKELRISVITTKRAYEELERDGFIVTMTGKGSFVSKKDIQLIREDYLKKIESHIAEALRLAAACGLTLEEVKEMTELIHEEVRDCENADK